MRPICRTAGSNRSSIGLSVFRLHRGPPSPVFLCRPAARPVYRNFTSPLLDPAVEPEANVATSTSQMRRMEKYIFSAKAVAAHFNFTNGHPDFGDQYTLTYHSDAPGEVRRDTGGRSGPEISFTNSSVHISCAKSDGVYTTIVRSALQGFNVHDVLTADSIE